MTNFKEKYSMKIAFKVYQSFSMQYILPISGRLASGLYFIDDTSVLGNIVHQINIRFAFFCFCYSLSTIIAPEITWRIVSIVNFNFLFLRGWDDMKPK